MIFSNNALKHVTYPTQVLAKSCKMIPVLLAGTIFGSMLICSIVLKNDDE